MNLGRKAASAVIAGLVLCTTPYGNSTPTLAQGELPVYLTDIVESPRE